MWAKFKNWWANLFNPKTKEPTEYVVINEQDPYTAAMLTAVMNSGKACVGSVDDEGKLTIEEID